MRLLLYLVAFSPVTPGLTAPFTKGSTEIYAIDASGKTGLAYQSGQECEDRSCINIIIARPRNGLACVFHKVCTRNHLFVVRGWSGLLYEELNAYL